MKPPDGISIRAKRAIKAGHVVLYRSILDLVGDFLHKEALAGTDAGRVCNEHRRKLAGRQAIVTTLTDYNAVSDADMRQAVEKLATVGG